MKFNYKLSKVIEDFISGAVLNEINIGCSDSQVVKIKKDDNVYFLKIAKKGQLTSEFKKLKWLEGKLEVPKIILYDENETTEFLITEAIKGKMICSDTYIQNPKLGLKIIATAFKKILNVNIEECPFDVSIDYKLNLVKRNVENNLIDISQLSDKTLEKYKSLENILQYLNDNKFYEKKCFSHGDTSLPNIFALGDKFSGFIDVGECGIADQWFDLAICEKSIKRNYGEEYISEFYKELNIIPDREKIDYYLLMMELYL